MADRKMSSVSAVSDMNFVYAETSTGELVKISKADLASVVAGIIGFGDTVPRHRGTIPEMDCNKATAAGFYYYYTEQGALSNSPSIARFVLEVSVAGSRIVQTATSFSTATSESGYGKMKTRAFSGSSWTPWTER